MKEMKGENLEEIVKGMLFDIGVLETVFEGDIPKYAEARSVTEEDILEISNRLKSQYDMTVEESKLRKTVKFITDCAIEN